MWNYIKNFFKKKPVIVTVRIDSEHFVINPIAKCVWCSKDIDTCKGHIMAYKGLWHPKCHQAYQKSKELE